MENGIGIFKKSLPYFLIAIFILAFFILTFPIGLHYLQSTAIVGFIANLLLIFTILCCSKFRKSTDNLYVLAKTIFDSIYLVAFNAEFFSIRSISYQICVLQDSLFLFGRQASVLAILAMLVERFMAIMCPEEYEKCSNTKKFYRWKIFSIFILGILSWQILLAMTSYAQNDVGQQMHISIDNSTSFPKCSRIQNGFRRISTFSSYIGNFFLPFILFILINSLIGFKVHYSMSNVKFMAKRSSRKSRDSSQSSASSSNSSSATKKYFPMHSAIPFIFPLVFVLLNSSIYALHFAYPPSREQEYSQNMAVMEMKGAADFANLCSFSINFPLFVLIKVTFS